jgi:hypothetical protein
MGAAFGNVRLQELSYNCEFLVKGYNENDETATVLQ